MITSLNIVKKAGMQDDDKSNNDDRKGKKFL